MNELKKLNKNSSFSERRKLKKSKQKNSIVNNLKERFILERERFHYYFLSLYH